MPDIEILGYYPRNLQEFLVFCVEGGPKPGETGVFEWLYARLIDEAHFYNSAANDPVQIFAATLKRDVSEPDPVPWMSEIVGLEERLFLDGLVGEAEAFPPLNKPLATVTHNQTMDDLFEQGSQRVKKVFAALAADGRSGFTFTAEQFRAALGGDLKADRQNILSEIEDNFKEPLFEKPNPEKILASLGRG